MSKSLNAFHTLILAHVWMMVCVMELLMEGSRGKHLMAPRKKAGSLSIKFNKWSISLSLPVSNLRRSKFLLWSYTLFNWDCVNTEIIWLYTYLKYIINKYVCINIRCNIFDQLSFQIIRTLIVKWAEVHSPMSWTLPLKLMDPLQRKQSLYRPHVPI